MARKTNRRTRSGAVGGPGTGGGLNFQVDFGVLQALEAVSRALVNPLEQPEIAMEPRIVSGPTDVTCWDVRISHPDRVTEAKLKPKRAEILEWLDRVAVGAQQNANREFELFYGRGAGPVLRAVEDLCRIAKEASGDADRFQRLVSLERSSDIDLVLEHVKTEPQLTLSRLRVTPVELYSLDKDIQCCLRRLVHESDRKRLYDLLFSKFHKSIEHRTTYKVRDLIDEAKQAGIEFFPPPTFEPQNLEPVVSGAIYILQNCESGLPAEVLAAGLGSTVEDVEQSLFKYVDRRVLTKENDLWAIAPIRPSLVHDQGSQLVAQALRQLLEFISANKKNAQGWDQVPNAIALAKSCQSDDPGVVSGLFWKLDKLLKRTGNKRLVLEVANLSVAAARRPSRTETITKGEAVALICGRSWVYQRVNRLPEARAEGEKSLHLGRDIGWHRNTAFCLKCLGRLFRMEAEQHRNDQAEFQALLSSSISHLEEAIHTFPQVTEMTDADRSSEVGDCQSLLGRTYLVAENLQKADVAAREAIDRLTDVASKDYADLQILLGDLAYARHDVEAAGNYYDDAIQAAGTSDAERSEIAARAFFQKGLATRSAHFFDEAAEIWTTLEENELADNSRWHSMVLGERVPKSSRDILSGESPSVRAETIRLHEARLEALSGSYRGRRSEPDKNYWTELIPEAKKNVAVRHVEW